jgi:hypothetical protein
MTAANTAPDLIPKTEIQSAIANSKLLLAGVKSKSAAFS